MSAIFKTESNLSCLRCEGKEWVPITDRVAVGTAALYQPCPRCKSDGHTRFWQAPEHLKVVWFSGP